MLRWTAWWFAGWVGILGCGSPADESGDDDSAVDAAAAIEIVETYPEEGYCAFYHRDNLLIRFSDAPTEASMTLDAGDFRSSIECVATASEEGHEYLFDPHGDGNEHLAPSTSYTATITWAWPGGTDQAELHFQTSGGPMEPDLLEEIVGSDYFWDLCTAEFTVPQGVGGLFSQYFCSEDVVHHIAAVDEGQQTIEMLSGPLEQHHVQDMCQPTMWLTESQVGMWDEPRFALGPVDLALPLSPFAPNALDAYLTGVFASDGGFILNGTLDGYFDTRSMDEVVDPGGEEGMACEAFENLGIDCVDCPDGSGRFCMFISAENTVSERISVQGVNPETGEEYDTLTEVTEDQVQAWVDAGFCP